jgi:hypothetical protein
MSQLREILSGQSNAIRLTVAFGAVLGITAVLFGTAAWRLRRRFLD